LSDATYPLAGHPFGDFSASWKPTRHRHRAVSSAHVRRTGIATAVVSTVGIALVNLTGLTHAEPTTLTGTQAATVTVPSQVTSSGTGTSGGTDDLSEPSLVNAPGQESLAVLAQRAAQDQLLHDQAVAQSSLNDLTSRENAARAAIERAAEMHWAAPIAARLTQRFGGADGHPGIDLGAPMGTPINAAHRGRVIYAGWESGYGNFIQIMHENNVVTCYGHLSKILVQVGQYVDTGQEIGLEGSTGHSTGPHLHFEVRIGGQYGTKINPLIWLNEHGINYTPTNSGPIVSDQDS
jgi:murein DD-endopeptidase MepM/ murein hydrolase activator NlpD